MMIISRYKIDYSYTNFIIPINLNNSHWLFCEIDFKSAEIIYYNSLSQANAFEILQIL